MHIATMQLQLHAPYHHTLKEKRAETKGLLEKLRRKFNVAAIEAAQPDVHNIIVLGVVSTATTVRQANSILDNVLRYVQGNTEAEVTVLEREIL